MAVGHGLCGHGGACPSQTNIMKQMSLKRLKLAQLLSYVCIALGHCEMKKYPLLRFKAKKKRLNKAVWLIIMR